MVHFSPKYVSAFKVDDVWHVWMLCGAMYSLELPRGELPWTHDATQRVTCELCKLHLSQKAAPETRPS